jgi:hypothetical protein
MSKPMQATVILPERNIWGDLRDNEGNIFLCDFIFDFFPNINKNHKVFELKISRRSFKGSRSVRLLKTDYEETVFLDDKGKRNSLFENMRKMIESVFDLKPDQQKQIYFSLTERE